MQDLSLPLVVAVTGHRDLVDDEVPAIRDRVDQFLKQLKKDYPSNRLMVMSPLAEGADMLVAESAVANRIEVIVPLPKPREDYLNDFVADAEKERFRRLCAHAADIFVLDCDPPPAPEGQDPDEWKNDYPYAHLGAYLSAHCHILLALWDGKSSERLGGTAQVVQFHHDDVFPGVTPATIATQQMLVDDESDLVYHIVCSRDRPDGEPQQGLVPLECYWFTKDENQPQSVELPSQHELIFQRTSEFSSDAKRFQNKILDSRYSLVNKDHADDLPPGLKDIDHLYGIADWLAIYYQRLTLRSLVTIHCFAFFMGLMFILYSDLESWRVYLVAFLACFGIAAGVQAQAKKGAWYRKYLDYRTLAEGLRVQYYWGMAGVSNENKWKFTHDSYLQSQHAEYGWIRNVMRVAGMRYDATPWTTSFGLKSALAEWVGDTESGQLGYFRVKAQERVNRNQLTDHLGKLSLACSVLVVFVFLSFASYLSEQLSDILTVIMGASLLLYAVREGYAYATVTKELINQYEYMLRIFYNAHRRLESAKSSDEIRQILFALGESALNEHADWLLMHRERSLDEAEIWHLGS